MTIESRGKKTILLNGMAYREIVTLLRWCDSNDVGKLFLPGGFIRFNGDGQLEYFLWNWREVIEKGDVPKADRRPGCPYYPTPKVPGTPVLEEVLKLPFSYS